MQEREQSLEESRCACSDGAAGTRNRYFRGKLLRAEEYRLEQSYGIERRRLLNRAISGWGVAYGLELDQQEGTVRISRGLALDRQGREIAVYDWFALRVDNSFALASEEPHVRSAATLEPGRYLLSIHYAERQFGDAHLPHECGCESPEKNFVRETALFSFSPLCGETPCPCAELECQHEHSCAGCEECGYAGRGPHAQLCRWVAHADVADGGSKLCYFHDHWLSPTDGVPLACVTLIKSEDPCAPLQIQSIDDACSPRRLVKNNDLLYDLIRGCDLTRVSEISWQAWHRAETPVTWEDFSAYFEKDGETRFVVTFSNAVLISSLTPEAIVITAYTREQATGWVMGRRVPSRLEPIRREGSSLPEDMTDQVRLRVNKNWLRDEIDTEKESWLSEHEFSVEIEIRGDLIVDCNRQSVDANARGLTAIPSGNGNPGGSLLSSFRVQAKPTEHDETSDVG